MAVASRLCATIALPTRKRGARRWSGGQSRRRDHCRSALSWAIDLKTERFDRSVDVRTVDKYRALLSLFQQVPFDAHPAVFKIIDSKYIWSRHRRAVHQLPFHN